MKKRRIITSFLATSALLSLLFLTYSVCPPAGWLRIRGGMDYAEVVKLAGEPEFDLRDLKGICTWYSDRMLTTSRMVIGFDENDEVRRVSITYFVE